MDNDETQRRQDLQTDFRLMLVITLVTAFIATWVVMLNVNEKAQIAISKAQVTTNQEASPSLK